MYETLWGIKASDGTIRQIMYVPISLGMQKTAAAGVHKPNMERLSKLTVDCGGLEFNANTGEIVRVKIVEAEEREA